MTYTIPPCITALLSVGRSLLLSMYMSLCCCTRKPERNSTDSGELIPGNRRTELIDRLNADRSKTSNSTQLWSLRSDWYADVRPTRGVEASPHGTWPQNTLYTTNNSKLQVVCKVGQICHTSSATPLDLACGSRSRGSRGGLLWSIIAITVIRITHKPPSPAGVSESMILGSANLCWTVAGYSRAMNVIFICNAQKKNKERKITWPTHCMRWILFASCHTHNILIFLDPTKNSPVSRQDISEQFLNIQGIFYECSALGYYGVFLLQVKVTGFSKSMCANCKSN